MKKTVSDEQIIEAISAYVAKNGYPPSIRDISEAIGIVSAGSMKYRLDRLRKAGLIDFVDGKARTIRVL